MFFFFRLLSLGVTTDYLPPSQPILNIFLCHTNPPACPPPPHPWTCFLVSSCLAASYYKITTLSSTSPNHLLPRSQTYLDLHFNHLLDSYLIFYYHFTRITCKRGHFYVLRNTPPPHFFCIWYMMHRPLSLQQSLLFCEVKNVTVQKLTSSIWAFWMSLIHLQPQQSAFPLMHMERGFCLPFNVSVWKFNIDEFYTAQVCFGCCCCSHICFLFVYEKNVQTDNDFSTKSYIRT